MAVGDPYALLDELTSKLAAACQDINTDCGRQFSKDDAPSARVFKPVHGGLVRVDDFYTTTGLIVRTDADGDGVYETTWTPSDYELSPLNGIVAGEPGWPYMRIRAVGSLTFPVGCGRAATVEVTTPWGWSAVPKQIHEAALLRASRLLRRKDSPEGVKGFSDMGVVRVSRYDPDYDKLIRRYVRKVVA